MNEADISTLKWRLHPADDIQIPSSSQCAERFPLSVTVMNGQLKEQQTVDCVHVGQKGITLVWKWRSADDNSEAVPEDFLYLPNHRRLIIRDDFGVYILPEKVIHLLETKVRG